ncbi:hypothetical protein FraQA3DRAFT_6010 [Frankia sp. QA3]|nr:hypothetical protein FraQA3DRAFT_6010 [Frankia sp. QA3]
MTQVTSADAEWAGGGAGDRCPVPVGRPVGTARRAVPTEGGGGFAAPADSRYA